MKRAAILLIVLALIVGMVGCVFPSRNLEIRTWYDLDAVRHNLNGHHILMNDLDSTTAGYEELASPTANQGRGWEPIGSYDRPFSGTFDGQGYEIRDLFINRPGADWAELGLFSAVASGGVIKNLGVVNATVTGYTAVGGLVAYNEGTVTDCYFTGSVTGIQNNVGGLVGWNFGTVSDCYATGNVAGDHSVGGLVGNSIASTVSGCYFTGSVTGHEYVGGLVGLTSYLASDSYATGSVTGNLSVGGLVGLNSDHSKVNHCYATGSVAGNYSVGDLVGDNRGPVSCSYATGDVTGIEDVGGLVGWNYAWGIVSNSYATGSVIGDSYVGGLVGKNYDDGTYAGNVSNSFWDTETSGMAVSGGGIGKTTAQMQDIDTFTGVGWDIVGVANSNVRDTGYIWNIVDDVTYPFLGWQA